MRLLSSLSHFKSSSEIFYKGWPLTEVTILCLHKTNSVQYVEATVYNKQVVIFNDNLLFRETQC